MEKAQIRDLFIAQKGLDETIHKNHGVSYENTFTRRTLALLVEIGELANTTRCFKFWSYKKCEAKEVVLDEYADGLHFFLSLGIIIDSKKTEYEIVKPDNDLTEQFLKIYESVSVFKNDSSEENYEKAFSNFFNLLPLLGYSWDDLEKAYYKKLGTNYVRQETNY